MKVTNWFASHPAETTDDDELIDYPYRDVCTSEDKESSGIAHRPCYRDDRYRSIYLQRLGEYFFYLEILEPEPNRMAWTAPIWVERI